MAQKPKATSDPPPPKRRMTQAEQSELFIKTARELGVDESAKQFETAFDNIAGLNILKTERRD